MKKKGGGKQYISSWGILGTTWWFFYFTSVLVLHATNTINLSLILTIGLAASILIPLPTTWPHVHAISFFRRSTTFLLSLVLLWHESALPDLATTWALLADPVRRFSKDFILQFIYQSFNPITFLAGLSLFLICLLSATYRLRTLLPAVVTASLLWAGFISVRGYTNHDVYAHTAPSSASGIAADLADSSNELTTSSTLARITTTDQTPTAFAAPQPPRNATPDERLDFIYQTEAARKPIVLSVSSTPDMDIVILQICSLGWEDLDAAHIDANPFFSQFDFIFTQFNSADSYSHTAAIRLLRGLCGLTDHDSLFRDAPQECYVLPSLRNLGYLTNTVFNHDGVYSGFTETVQRFGSIDAPIPVTSLYSTRIGFDGSPVYRDYDALSLWLQKRAGDNQPHALFYNSIYLHAGDHEAADKDWWKRTNEANYNTAVTTMTGDLIHFFDDIKTTGRKTIVVLVGEHGAALKKTPLQLQAIREIPLPGITIVPAAVKIFGPGFNDRSRGLMLTNNQPVSYTGLYTLINRLLLSSPTSPSLVSSSIFSRLPESLFFATGDKGIAIQDTTKFWHRNGSRPFEVLPSFVTIPKAKLSTLFTPVAP